MYVNNSMISSAQSSGSTKNGVKIHNSTLNIKNSPISDYTSGRFVRVNEGSVVKANSVWVSSSDVYWEDGSGYIIGGNRIMNSFGSISFTQ